MCNDHLAFLTEAMDEVCSILNSLCLYPQFSCFNRLNRALIYIGYRWHSSPCNMPAPKVGSTVDCPARLLASSATVLVSSRRCALSLKHALTLVARRAHLVREAWGEDKGSMMAVEADESLVHILLKHAGRQLDHPASIACYNGPRSFTLSGSVKAIDAVAEVITSNSDKFLSIRYKRLNDTNAFHSSLVDPLLDRLEQVGNDLEFHEPSIPLERATETPFAGPLTARFVRDHMRSPVFAHAMQRLAKEHPSAIFLGAGSSSTITAMASRALAGQANKSHHFEPVSVTNDEGLDGLTDTTASLWKQGLRVAFWGHHTSQTKDYRHILLPPYQFEKTRH